MAFLGKGKKEDLFILAHELDIEVNDDFKLLDLKNAIINSTSYDENITKEVLNRIISDRKESEERNFELEKLKLQTITSSNKSDDSDTSVLSAVDTDLPKIEIKKLMPNFNEKTDDMSLFLNLFERQLSFLKVPQSKWVIYLIGLLPNEIAKLIVKETDDIIPDYENIKKILLHRFKMSAEKFRQLFVQHKKGSDITWRDFCYDLKTFFEGWINDLNITTFDQLKNLIIADQIKKKCPPDVKDHFLDQWSELNDPFLLCNKLDSYEEVRTIKGKNYSQESKQHKYSNFVGSKNNMNDKESKLCINCKGTHQLYKCTKFKSMDVVARKNFVKRNNCCFLCLHFHKVKDCPNHHLKCYKCDGKHNTLLHEDNKSNTAYTVNCEDKRACSHSTEGKNCEFNMKFPTESVSHESQINSSVSFNNSKAVSFLPTAKVLLYDNENKPYSFRALLDSGSECSFVHENVVKTLGLKRKNDRIILNGISGISAGQTRGSVTIKIGSRLSKESINVQAYILPKVTSHLPAELLDTKNIEYLKNIVLADDDFMKPQECDLILGSDCFFQILRYGKILGNEGEPIAQNTLFGWVVAGRLESKFKCYSALKSHFINVESEANVDTLLQKFWQTENINVKKPHLSEEEEFCEHHFQSTYKINPEGRFEVRLPLYKEKASLGNSKDLAISRLFAMEKKFQFDENLEGDYKKFMKEYEDLGHMKLVENNSDYTANQIYYLPHHSVIKKDSISTKLRVVFDGSCKPTNGNSLNSVLAVGQILQPDLFSILIRFRTNPVAFTADIQQMYRQILISPEDQDLQRIFWRASNNSPIKEYKLCTVTYGTSSAPFLATRCLHQIGKDIEITDPAISSIIRESFYIDDCMSGSVSNEEAIKIIDRLSQVLENRGFHLRKWRSNSADVLSHLSSNSLGMTNLEIHPDDCSKALGLTWDSSSDTFLFKVDLKFDDKITKRTFLSQSAKLFDPLGFLAPCTISIKIFYQQLWLMKLDWDTALPEHCQTKWKKFQSEFEQVYLIRIPRWIQVSSKEIICHGFSDASELAYAAVIYVVQPLERKTTILMAKSKVAPLKPVSIPRLELNGALLLARLYAVLVNILNSFTIRFHAWTDSQVVLSWLSSHPRCWKPYVANRTAEILDSIPCDSWGHVPGRDNPADIASRGIAPKDLVNCSLWWEGPKWLSLDQEHWPKQSKIKTDSDIVNKEKKNSKICFVAAINNSLLDLLFVKYSSFTKIVDILAFCIRFIRNCKQRLGNKKLSPLGKFCPLSTGERRHAGNVIISYVQQLYFSEEINCLKANNCVSKRSSLSSLCPLIDSDGLLRIGGRLENSSLSYNAKHPIILPSQHKLSSLIVNYFHVMHLHAGLNVLLGIIRQTYWIIGVKKLIKKCIHKCIICCRYRAATSKQLMGDLPLNRVTPNRPFSACGIDYAGPITILKYRGRGAKTTKCYIVLFVCFATKALHLELVSDLTSEAFIASLKRFCSRRGAPQHIYSDNATTFVGAKRQLSDIYNFVCSIDKNEKICYFLSQRNIEWHMIPPVSPHFGGLWEAAVRSVKFHIKRVTGNANLTFEELYTLLTQIESILNSRPLVVINNDDNLDNVNVLTPSHFLTGDIITSPPEHLTEDNLSLRSRWDIVQKMKLCFWKRWSIDYLSSLQNRKKWRVSKKNFKVNDVVILKEDNVPPSVWPLGKIIETHPGKDGMVRVVTVKTAKGNFKRPVVKLCLLPVHQE